MSVVAKRFGVEGFPSIDLHPRDDSGGFASNFVWSALMGLTLTLNVASQILLCLFIMICYILHLIFEEGLLRPIVRMLLGPGVWAA